MTKLFLLLLAFAFAAGPRGGYGQSAEQRPRTRVPATIVLVEQLPPADGHFRIERRLSEPRDVIVLGANATRDELSDAIRALLLVRQVDGDSATQPARMRMRPRQGEHGRPREFPWVPRVLADLRRAEPRPIEGFGRVRAVEIWLPPQRRHSARVGMPGSR